MRTGQTVEAAAGDVVEISSRRVGEPGRTGEVLEVLGDGEHVHYRVRWEDGHTSLLYPSDGTSFRHFVSPAEDVLAFLREASVEFEVLPHRRTLTAAGEAEVLGVLPQTVAKTVVAEDEEGQCIRAVVPATSRLDLRKLADAVGAAEVRLLSETDLVRAYPELELGAVPPFAGPAGDLVVVDRQVATCEHVVLEAGVHVASVRLRSDDLVEITSAQVADIAV